ncbi:tellurite resistance protein [Ectothiorhodospira magna]|uniref:Tellurite resistance protein n=1 Tax=Ectothiorhodospira magna TaxID=867345 RepID=A0A1H9DPF1_9GAMM|nr:SLAC1 anion channel family protein [Ectothiorhodospira magna]SEQ15291.1 tellurite resistance protein [Ectothiorhodospira magna]
MNAQPRLPYFPVAWFAMIMGLLGFAIVWSRADALLAVPSVVGDALRIFAVVALLGVATLYLTKLIRHRDAVVKELNHPIKRNFFATISISLILLSIAFLEDAPGLSLIFWSVGAALHLLFTLYVMSVWINHTNFQIQHMNPAWFIPVVGNILVPIAGVHHASPEISWLFFSIGLVFWIVLLTIVFYRIIFHDPLPERLVPTLFILVAPPAVGFISYLSLTDSLDPFARVLFYTGLFLTLLLFSLVGRFGRLKFFISWWAYSFPMAAMTLAAIKMHGLTGDPFHYVIGVVMIAVLTFIIGALLIRTGIAVKRREICVEE